jgi:hypothetical protein
MKEAREFANASSKACSAMSAPILTARFFLNSRVCSAVSVT